MNRQEIIDRLDKSLDFDQIKKDFIELWSVIFDLSLGEVNYLKLCGEEQLLKPGMESERYLAFILVGIARVISTNIGDCPGDAEEYWTAACYFLEDMPIREAEKNRYRVRITCSDKAA